MLRSSSAGKAAALAKTLDDNHDNDEEKLTGRLLGAADPTVVTKNHQRRNNATIQVIAPSNLEAGYQFTVQLEGKSYMVEVVSTSTLVRLESDSCSCAIMLIHGCHSRFLFHALLSAPAYVTLWTAARWRRRQGPDL